MKSIWTASKTRRLLKAFVILEVAVLFIASLTLSETEPLAKRSASKHGRDGDTRDNNQEHVFTDTEQEKKSNNAMWIFNTVENSNTSNNRLPPYYSSMTLVFKEEKINGTLKSEVQTSPYNQSTAADTKSVPLHNQTKTADTTTTIVAYSRSTVDNSTTISLLHGQSAVDNTKTTLPPYGQSTSVDPRRYSIQHDQSTTTGSTTGLLQTSQQTGVTTRANIQHKKSGRVGTEPRGDVTPTETTLSSDFCTTNESNDVYTSDVIHKFTTTDFVECLKSTNQEGKFLLAFGNTKDSVNIRNGVSHG